MFFPFATLRLPVGGRRFWWVFGKNIATLLFEVKEPTQPCWLSLPDPLWRTECPPLAL